MVEDTQLHRVSRLLHTEEIMFHIRASGDGQAVRMRHKAAWLWDHDMVQAWIQVSEQILHAYVMHPTPHISPQMSLGSCYINKNAIRTQDVR